MEQPSIPEDDWAAAEAEALLDADPDLRADIRLAMVQLRAGTLPTVDTVMARATIEAHISAARFTE